MPTPIEPLPRSRRLAVAGALMVLLAALFGARLSPGLSSATPRGTLHRLPPSIATTPAHAPAHPAPAVRDIADRVLPVAGAAGTLEAVDPSYRAEFDARGVHYP